jgi:anti-sigma factor RsiW
MSFLNLKQTQTCEQAQAQFSAALDGTLTGHAMHRLDAHMQGCGECEAELAGWKQMQQGLGSLRQVPAPADLGLRLRVAISQARAKSVESVLSRWELQWQNTVRPLALQCSAGLASALAVITVIGMMFGVFAAPQGVQASTAKDEPLGMVTAPHFLYSLAPSAPLETAYASGVVVEVFLGADGRVYDYKVLAGDDSDAVRAQLNQALYFSVFAPATVFGQPVRGHAVVAYAGVAVRG